MRDRSHPLELLPQAASARAAAGVRHTLVPHGPNRDGRARDGLVDLASNDYLGLCGYERLNAAAAEAARVWGTGSTGSRLVTGTTVLHARLEAALAAVLGAPNDLLIVSDAGNHAFSQAVRGRHTLMLSEGYGTANFCFPSQMRRRGAHGLRGIGRPPGDRAIAAAPRHSPYTPSST